MNIKTSITQIELKKLIEAKTKLILLDVRSKEEFEQSHISFAENIPLSEIEKNNFNPEANTIIVTACGKGGGRSESAANHIRTNSSNQVYFLEGGTFGWLENEIRG